MKRTELLIFLFLSTLHLGVAQDRIPVLSELLENPQSDYIFIVVRLDSFLTDFHPFAVELIFDTDMKAP